MRVCIPSACRELALIMEKNQKKVQKLNSSMLRRLVSEALFGDAKSTEDAAKDVKEIEPGEEADTLEKHVDMIKALKIEETRLLNRLATIKENKRALYRRVSKLADQSTSAKKSK